MLLSAPGWVGFYYLVIGVTNIYMNCYLSRQAKMELLPNLIIIIIRSHSNCVNCFLFLFFDDNMQARIFVN